MNALVCASNGILLTVNKHKSTADEKGVAMYALSLVSVTLLDSLSGELRINFRCWSILFSVRASLSILITTTWVSFLHSKLLNLVYFLFILASSSFLDDLIHDHLSDPEAIYRVEELLSVIKYVCTLDLHMKDKSETLLPYNLMEKNVKWELIKSMSNDACILLPYSFDLFLAIEIVPDSDKASVVNLLITTLNILSKKANYLENSFSISSFLNDHQRETISKHCQFFSHIFELLGLTIAVCQLKEPLIVKSESKKEEFSLSSLIGITIGFTLKYDLSIYARIAAGITEFYLDREFVRTGKWDRPIYVWIFVLLAAVLSAMCDPQLFIECHLFPCHSSNKLAIVNGG